MPWVLADFTSLSVLAGANGRRIAAGLMSLELAGGTGAGVGLAGLSQQEVWSKPTPALVLELSASTFDCENSYASTAAVNRESIVSSEVTSSSQ